MESNEEYLWQFAVVIAREMNVCPRVFYILSQLNTDYYSIMQNALRRLKSTYYKYAPWVAKSYHRSLLNCPIEYTGSCIRTVPIPNMMGAGGGIRFLDSDPPLFDDHFLQQRTPALTGISILTTEPVEFYYRIGIQDTGTIASGRVTRDDYVKLPPRKVKDDVENPENAFLPGRYFLNLDLIFDINPLLLYNQALQGRLILNAAYSLMWCDIGDRLEPILKPNISVIVNHFTHFILRFKTAPTASIDPLRIGLNIRGVKNPNMYSFVTDYTCNKKYKKQIRPAYTIDDIISVTEAKVSLADALLDTDSEDAVHNHSADDSSSE